MSDKPVNMGLQLFPPPPKKANKSLDRRNPFRPDPTPSSASERSQSPAFPSDGRQSAMDGRQSALGGRQSPAFPSDGRQSAMDGRQSALGGRQTPQTLQTGRQTPQTGRESPIPAPSQVHFGSDIPRSHTSFSEAPTLVRSNSNSSHNSTAKTGLNGSLQRGEPVMHSIFPRYNPDIPLEHQPYYPTQASPTFMPKNVINRRPYSPSVMDRSLAGLQSPIAVGASPGCFPRGVQDETILEPCTTEELKDLWKVVNGWRVSASEGRSFCLRMNSDAEEPVHTLSSSTQTFYTLRVEPTSTSAQMTMTRLDPNKPAKAGSPKPSTSSKPNTGIEVMSTTLEEAARRLPPNDGLVALLYPRAASEMALDVAAKDNRADQDQVIAAAERECGRLVWDEDSQKYYLVHPAIPTPFVVAIASSPAWSRVEYTLEHPELPRNLIRLVRDGAGGGFLEVNTGVAARIDCFYVVDVAICAIMLVAIAEEKSKNIERFDAPPPSFLKSPMSPKSLKGKGKKDVKMEEFEMDLESQNSVKEKKEKKEEKVPGCLGLIWMMIKCFVWMLTASIKAFVKIIAFLCKCLTRSSK